MIGEAAKFTMGARTSDSSPVKARGPQPGPGAYQPVDVNVVSAKYSMKGKYKVGTQLAITADGGHEKLTQSCDFVVPGPGTYSAKNDVVYRNHGNSKFGTETRPSINQANLGANPAPNAYSRDSKNNVLKAAPKFGFGTSQRPQSHYIRNR